MIVGAGWEGVVMTDSFGLVVELDAGIWIDVDVAGKHFFITRLGQIFEIFMPQASGFCMSKPETNFPEEYEWGKTAGSGLNYWGFLSNHERNGNEIFNETYNVKRFVVTSEFLDASEDFEAARKAFISAWGEVWAEIQVALEVASSQDFDTGSNLETGATENCLHVQSENEVMSHLIVDLGTHPIIQASSIDKSFFERSLMPRELESEVWTAQKLLRDARIRFNSQEYSTSFLHIATALEIFLSFELGKIPAATEEIENKQNSGKSMTLGTWVGLWDRHVNHTFKQRVSGHVSKRNRIIHDGAEVGDRETFDFYSIVKELIG